MSQENSHPFCSALQNRIALFSCSLILAVLNYFILKVRVDKTLHSARYSIKPDRVPSVIGQKYFKKDQTI